VFESSWPTAAPIKKIFRRVVRKSTGGILKAIPESVDPVGNAFLYCLVARGNMNTAALLRVPEITLRLRAPSEDRRLGECWPLMHVLWGVAP